MKQRVFVYGTFKKGFPLHYYLKKNTYIGKGTLDNYEMYEVASGGYPAIIRGKGKINGEVYEVDNYTIFTLDMVEGEGYLFKREWETIVMEDGRKIHAWVYVYLRMINGEQKRIPSGEWKQEG